MRLDRSFRLSDVPGAGVHCSPEGLFIGQTEVLERVCVQNGRPEWRVRPSFEIERDLSKTYGMPLEARTKISGLVIVARSLDRGDLVQAQIATLLLKFPDPPSTLEFGLNTADFVDLAKRLFASDLLKRDWDPTKHPRWPAGSPDAVGGQFAPSDSVDQAPEPGAPVRHAQITIPLDIPAPEAVPIPLPSEIVPPLVAPNILPRSLPQNPYPNRPQCVKEWQEAFQFCWGLKTRGLLGRGDYRGMGRTLRDCILGQVSQSCGGNAVTI